MVEKLFRLKERRTNVKTEIAAGITTFMTMAYILAINPNILSSTGMDATAVLLATCLASFIGTVCMAFMANLPFALSAGMGLNAYMAYTVCGNLGYSWQVALLAVFIEGIIFIILSLTKVREAIFDSIPLSLKRAVSVGIGLFIAFIGLQNAGLAVDSATLVELVDFRENFSTTGICALLAVIGLLTMAILYIKRVRGSILIGIFATWILGIICELAGLYVPDADMGAYTLIPSFHMTDFTSISKTFGQCFNVDFDAVGIFNFIVVVFSFLFVDLFDTLGTLIGVSTKAGLLDKDGKLPAIRPALMADAVATTAGAVLGTSTTTTFVESSAGTAAGGRTGLTALTTAVLFLLSMFLAPIFIAIPAFATAPALILVGFLMFSTVSEIKVDEKNYASAIPAYLSVIAMPLFYSISEGIAIGVISYVVINLACKKYKEINPIMYILAVLFVLKYIFL
ncbi:NCS2 family permease [Ruminococcus flavefaciens]|uniref:NCS2 family permease n=1 Tax=Ruminococcus flavefaciens TaxID=1265 RepID=UPI00049073CF|nr:NCS2 family permease [Ruminococcus flavefaciens]